MKPVFDQVLIFSPSVKTGGPEALHQLGHHIELHGGTARMVYYDRPVSIAGDVIRCGDGPFPLLEHFAHYRPQVLRETKMGPNSLVVFPEVLSKLATGVAGAKYQRAFWWLSVDNAFVSNPALLEQNQAKTFFEDRTLLHLHQSEYARCALLNNRAAQRYPLSDYTDPQFIERSSATSNNPPIASRGDVICFFPRKGLELAKRFLETSGLLRHQPAFAAINDMTKAQVSDTLFKSKIYIDFGHHPGKDRVPREAAIAGAVVLLHAAGAANYFADHPLLPEYRFTQDDIVSGRLHRQIDDILDDPERHFAAQRYYRQAIRLEREQFDHEVRSFFFEGL